LSWFIDCLSSCLGVSFELLLISASAPFSIKILPANLPEGGRQRESRGKCEVGELRGRPRV
jgi:hypothetical protein